MASISPQRPGLAMASTAAIVLALLALTVLVVSLALTPPGVVLSVFIVVLLLAIFVAVALALVPIISLVMMGPEAMARRRYLRRAAEIARAAGISGPVRVWGRALDVEGQCPTGPTPRVGDQFVVADAQVRPALCEHATRAVVSEVARMERGEDLPHEVVVYQDPDHRLELELHREPTASGIMGKGPS